MILCKAGALHWLTNGLAAIGQMALSNYVLQVVLRGGRMPGLFVGGQPRLVAALPFWAARMVLAFAHVLEKAGNAA